MMRLFTRFFVVLGVFVVAGFATVASAADEWCGNSYITLGPAGDLTWKASTNFHGLDLGRDLAELYVGGELQVYPDQMGTSAELWYKIKENGVEIVQPQSITLHYFEAAGNNGKWRTLASATDKTYTPVDVIAAHQLAEGDYSLAIWFHAMIGDVERWDSNGSANYVATFSVASSSDPRIYANGETALALPETGDAQFDLTFSLSNATAAAWTGVLKDGASTIVSNWNATGSTGRFTWDTAVAGNWSLLVTAYSDAGAATAITNRTFTLSATEDTAMLGTAWHCPTNQEPYAGVTMCLPLAPSAGNTIWLRVGNYQPHGDTSGGNVWYRFGDSGAWLSTNLTYETSTGAWSGNEDERNVFYMTSIPSTDDAAGKTLQYYFELNYTTNVPDKETTYVFRSADDPNMYSLSQTEARAQARPFGVRFAGVAGTEPGFIWHGGNITRASDSAVQVWVKIGYVTDGLRWADEVKVEYVIQDETSTTGRKSGVKAIRKSLRAAKALANPTIVPMRYSHSEQDSSGLGNAMWWMATIDDPALTSDTAVLKYEIYARKTAESGGTGNWLQAEYTHASTQGDTFEYRMYSDGSGDLKVNGVAADYTTSKFFIDEADPSDIVKFTITYAAPDDAEAVELFTNLGRRDYVDVDMDGDGWPDGMVPPDGNWVTAANSVNGYWQAIPMTKGVGAYEKTLDINKCGAYRITARYKAAGATNWTWYSDGPEGIKRRDHAVVISPKKALAQTMYELNTLVTKATTEWEEGRGTFETLSETMTAANKGTYNEFSLEYLNKLGVNCLWFQPIHPSGDTRVEQDTELNDRYYPGSPYATKNYFAVNKYMSNDKTEEAALTAFTNFVRLCDRAQGNTMDASARRLETVNVMLDGVMNHTSWDAIYGAGLKLATNGLGAAALAELAVHNLASIPESERIATQGRLGINWYSWKKDYSTPATEYTDAWNNNVATAPERVDFGKWDDVAELFYGNYSTMVRWDDRDPPDYNLTEETSRMYNEDDMYYYGEMRPETKLLWKYMAAYPEFWLKQTGHSGLNQPGVKDASGVLLDDYGIDGLRCDYAQGLPSHFWEYLINRTRSFKWNFLFMAESLDGGQVGYRSNRHFDILNENMVFRFTQDQVSSPVPFQDALEDRRGAYGEGIILLNLTCHDEPVPFGDPWATASRYAMVSAIDGVPMIFHGQEQAISRFDYDMTVNKWKGFYRFEQNFGKWIPHFKKWNKMFVWEEPAYASGDRADSRAMANFYGLINHARLNSPALQSKHRWFLNDNDRIMAVGKWEKAGENPNVQDSVFATVLFVNEKAEDAGIDGAAQTYDISGFAAAMGIENRADRFYNVKNIASTSGALLWSEARSGADIHANGIYVGFAGTLTAANAWSDGAVAQYLKFVDVTDYPVPVFSEIFPTGYVNTAISFTVVATGDGNPVTTSTGVSPDVAYTYESGIVTFTPSTAGTYTFSFAATNQYNALSATTSISVTVLDETPSPELDVEIADITIPSFSAGGTHFNLSARLLLPDGITLDSVDVWTADEVIGGSWNWSNETTAIVVEGIATVDLPVESQKVISIGKPGEVD